MFLIWNVDAPRARILFAEISSPPLERVFSDTSKLPMSIGSMDGISNSGIPLTSDGRSFSILVTMHAVKFESLLWQMCNTSAIGKKMKFKIKNGVIFFFKFYGILFYTLQKLIN